ncbi:MAG: transglutaminase-like domain-containing protein [Nitrospinae bacterium]|nr:transglutaminase-like domain-containing protein [Nitrospinota bacterium]
MSDSQLEAVCRLLSDGSPGVTTVLDRQVSEFSTEDQKRLLDMMKKRQSSEVVLPPSLMEFHYKQIEIAFSDWSLSSVEDVDLEDACFLLASFGHPLENMEMKKDELLGMENHLRRRLEGISKADAVVDEVVEYLHGELRFDGERGNYYDAQNSFMNRVLERRRGIPISLSALYLILAWRLGLPFHGVGMPGHFIVKFQGDEEPIFLDPFDRGKRLSVGDCAGILRGLGYHFDMRFLQATPPRRIVERMINNLLGIYKRDGQDEKVTCLLRCRELVQRV